MLTWSRAMEELLGAFKNEKISSTVLILIILGAWYAHSWASEEFVKKSEFGELKSLMVNFIEDDRIVNASQLLRDKELQLQIAIATSQSDGQISNIETEITEVKAYKECLIHKDPNCKHLKPPE
jgi:hypothetical protein